MAWYIAKDVDYVYEVLKQGRGFVELQFEGEVIIDG